MRRCFLVLTAFLVAGCAGAWAQNGSDEFFYQFSDKDGNVIADGTTIVCSEAEEDMFGGVEISSGLFVKNVSAPSNYMVRIDTEITRIDNGAVQVCFPTNCYSFRETGLYKSESTQMADGEMKSIQSEWIPEDAETFGECFVTYTAMSMMSMGFSSIDKGGPSVTVHYVFGMGVKGDVNGDGVVDVADISAILSQMAETQWYDKADVNGDGTTDVADISTVLTIMSEK